MPYPKPHMARTMDKTENERLLIALEMGLLDPAIRSSATQLADLIADDFVEFGSSGETFDKEQIIAKLLAETESTPQTRTAEDFTTRWLAEDTALVTFHAIRAVNGTTTKTLRASIWKYRNTRWQMIFHQGTLAS